MFDYYPLFVPEQSKPKYPLLHLQSPDLTSHRPFPLQGVSPPGHDFSGSRNNLALVQEI